MTASVQGGVRPPVAARLQRDVKIGSGCILGAVREGVALGVKAADVLVPALSDDAAVLDDDAADHGVGVYMTRRRVRRAPEHGAYSILFDPASKSPR